MRRQAIQQLVERFKVDAAASPAAAGLHRAMNRITAAADAFDGGVREVRADKNWSQQGRRNQIEKLCRAHADALGFAEGATESARSHIATRRKTIGTVDRDPTDLVGELRRGELRAFVRTLPVGERINASLNNRDIAVAVLDGLPALSGLTEQQANQVRDYVLTQHPEAEELAALEHGIVAVESAYRLLSDMMRDAMIGF